MAAAVSNQLIIPIALWGDQAPTHCISAIYLTKDLSTLVTGCNDGQICLWDVQKGLNLIPRCILLGHTGRIMCFTETNSPSVAPSTLLASSSQTGEMCLWDMGDGRCLESVKSQYIHTRIQNHQLVNHDEQSLLCIGYYSEILIVDALTLDIMFTLTAKVSPDWISAIHILKVPKRPEDFIIGLSIAGVIKVWSLSGNETRSSEPIYEDESKPIRCLNAIRLTCCRFNARIMLIVCTKYWQIYDATDFSLLSSVDCPPNERWSGGDFISGERVLIWSDIGKGYLYKLPSNKLEGRVASYASCIPENKLFRQSSVDGTSPKLYSQLLMTGEERLLCPPAMNFVCIAQPVVDGDKINDDMYFMRGDSFGRVGIWKVADPSPQEWEKIQQEKMLVRNPDAIHSLSSTWQDLQPQPCGIIDQLREEEGDVKLTASVYLPLQGRLVVGREDGSIIIVSATHVVMLELFYGLGSNRRSEWSQHQVLHGHSGRINCLLYPYHTSTRYDIAHLISGGVDFSVCLWDLYAGTLLHRFSVHAGEINQLLVPPKDCSPRVQQCICSVASDHSVALLSLKEKKCITLASRHLFPIQVIKWRPLDDFMIVGCVDGSVYVWQIETGHLDRVVHGLCAEDILGACDLENVVTAGDKLTNPAIHLFRGLRHRNLAAIKHAAARGFHQIAGHDHKHREVIDLSIRNTRHPLMIQGLKSNPKDQDSHVLFFDVEALIVHLMSDEYSLMSPNTLENEGLTTNAEYQRYYDLANSPETQNALSGLFSKVKDHAGSAARNIQQKAESVGLKNVPGSEIAANLYRKASSASTDSLRSMDSNMTGMTPGGGQGAKKPGKLAMGESNLTMESAQLLLSLLHAWGLDKDLDKVCKSKLGLLRPQRTVCFGLLSKGGHMALLLPTFMQKIIEVTSQIVGKTDSQEASGSISGPSGSAVGKSVRMDLPPELAAEEQRARKFARKLHWELSTAMTTNHLLAIISMANTLMSMNSATFILQQEIARKAQRKSSRSDSKDPALARTGSVREKSESQDRGSEKETFSNQQTQIKQGWSLLAALHCVLLPELVKSEKLKTPLLEILARRWQDRCLEVREAAQALLLAELRRMGPSGRKKLVEEWSPFLPTYSDRALNQAQIAAQQAQQRALQRAQQQQQQGQHGHGGGLSQPQSLGGSPSPTPRGVGTPSDSHAPIMHRADFKQERDHSSGEEDDDDDDTSRATTEHGGAHRGDRAASEASGGTRRPSQGSEGRRRQWTAIVLLGVIGAEYGAEIESSKRRTTAEDSQRKKNIVEGFSSGNYSVARNTSQALAYLLLAPPSKDLPLHTSHRRAAIDLLGRGFTVWEPYLDVAKILLGMLEFCTEADKLVPTMSFGLPLTPPADSFRAARHALTLIATARPAAFITTLAREVTRINSIQQNPNSMNVNLHISSMSRSKPEILRNIEILIEKMPAEISNLIIETMDIVLFCLDHSPLKSRGLGDVFPPIVKFQNVSYCMTSRRIAVGARNGNLAIYEIKTPKCQLLPAHSTPITAVSFSHDGRYLVSYALQENKLCFWSTATGLFNIGQSHTKCVRTYNCPQVPAQVIQTCAGNPHKMAKLIWIANKTVILMFADGSEVRFNA